MKTHKNKIRIIYVFSFIDRSLLNEAIALHLSKVSDFDPAFIMLDQQPGAFAGFLKEHKLRHWNIKITGKPSLVKAFFKILKILIAEKPQVINVNLLESTITALPAAWLCGIPVRILTRHYGTLHHDYHPHFVTLDRLFNRLATHILAPSEIISKILREREQADPKKITVIPHGLPLDDFAAVPSENVDYLRSKYLKGRTPYPVIGVISRFVHWKGIQYIIPAFARLLNNYPDAHLLLANAKGNYQKELMELLSRLPSSSYTLIEFEKDSASLYRLMNVFVHVPVNEHSEAYGQVYIEAMASGIPSVITLSGIATEYIRHREHAWVVPYCSSEAIYEGMLTLLNDESLRQHLVNNGRKAVYRLYHESVMNHRLENFIRNAVSNNQNE